ncbi:hypothetical protein CsSME_00048657 [Camellia sinensis var. sinensis]
MSIRFKFRRSVNFDSVDIEGRSSISVGDLRSKIVLHKHLNICQDFDLVFSDALTGHEFHDENFQSLREFLQDLCLLLWHPSIQLRTWGRKTPTPLIPLDIFP